VSFVAEVTHRYPLQCSDCFNRLECEKGGIKLDTATWRRVLDEAAELSMLQVASSDGEPTLRRDPRSGLRSRRYARRRIAGKAPCRFVKRCRGRPTGSRSKRPIQISSKERPDRGSAY
jgi:hypothetical protein